MSSDNELFFVASLSSGNWSCLCGYMLTVVYLY
jgi:hypothetical protein